MNSQKGHKALIVLTDGLDRGSKETLDAAFEAAQRADTVVYSILFKDDDAYSNRGGGGSGGRGGGRTWGRSPPARVPTRRQKGHGPHLPADGGRMFEVSKKQPIDKIYTELQEELRNQNNLGYTPAKSDEGSGYRKIALTTKQKDLVVQAPASDTTRTGRNSNPFDCPSLGIQEKIKFNFVCCCICGCRGVASLTSWGRAACRAKVKDPP